ncbi:hypothetical protein BSN82_03520 [Acinetobacter baylyi]|uniref:DUF7944 domain-containing protein n=2 Tax=Acinetobacter baylyi TaxID=202950 RepID=Q6FCV7_ACIAD|nr:hypothetical protein F952_01429 [Acinetobacter baylyi DSM 14961 = CIP 107474]KAF2370379.1 hypothetical protein BSL88_09680 [Acinetobacter baylyi]CAG68102.1 conserved hypothetical protein; putative signal peptide [Acinetobacter baylyi ADP1]KAF2373988.1 hypothetical protein BSL67_10100 [Acinetobacter baylyi]KAF2377861.1 hypothetical protein BSN81_07305 [Acinetobacter baylyi]
MKNTFLKSISAVLLAASCSFISVTHAAEAKDLSENIEVTPQEGITQEELAAIRVLQEICPKFVGKEKSEFDAGYARLVKDYMPNEKNPEDALNRLSKQKDFQKFLKQARDDAKNAGDEQNREVCADVKSYKS